MVGSPASTRTPAYCGEFLEPRHRRCPQRRPQDNRLVSIPVLLLAAA